LGRAGECIGVRGQEGDDSPTRGTGGVRRRYDPVGQPGTPWQNGQSWVGIKTHMGYNQEAYDAECAAVARALETAARRQTTPERVTIFTDAQAAIRRMASEDLARAGCTRFGPGGTSRRYGEPARVSPSGYGGAPPTRESQGTRKPTSGRSSRPTNRTRAVWNGWREVSDRCRSRDHSRTSSARYQRSGLRPDDGRWPDHQQEEDAA
jgi:ribonuclease HI